MNSSIVLWLRPQSVLTITVCCGVLFLVLQSWTHDWSFHKYGFFCFFRGFNLINHERYMGPTSLATVATTMTSHFLTLEIQNILQSDLREVATVKELQLYPGFFCFCYSTFCSIILKHDETTVKKRLTYKTGLTTSIGSLILHKRNNLKSMPLMNHAIYPGWNK